MIWNRLLAQRTTRRRLLKGAGVGIVAAIVGSGRTQSPAHALTSRLPSPASAGFFDAVTELRESVRGSADHLGAAAARTIATKDVAALFRLVHDEIATYPAGSRSTGDLVREVRWGIRATLRGGAGTPREKADLLAELYGLAGYEAEVVRVDVDAADTVDLFTPRPRPVFAPSIGQARLAIVRQTLRLPDRVEVLPPLDPEGNTSKALADGLLSRLTARPTAQEPFAPETAYALPMVRLVCGSQTLLADPSGHLGLIPLATRQYQSAPSPDGVLDVEVLIEAARSDLPSRRFTLVRGRWTAAEIAGRRLYLGFVPPVESLEEFAAIRPRDVGMLVPVLTVRGPDIDVEESSALSVRGTAVTLGGQLVDVDGDDGTTRIDGEEVGTAGTDPAVVAQVTGLEIAVRAAGFPIIDVALRAVDHDGRFVSGLGAAAFQVVEDGTSVGHTLLQSTAPPPRILFLLDDSTSIPDDFRGPGAAALLRQVADALLTADTRSTFRVAMVDDDGATPTGDWTFDVDELTSQATRRAGFGSQLWESLADAGRLVATVIIFLTDGAATDEGDNPVATPPRATVARVRIGPPAVVIGIGDVDKAGLGALGAAGGLGSFPVAAPEEVVDVVRDALADAPEPPYRLRYVAPVDGPSLRLVQVRLRGTGVDAEATYEVPSAEDRASPTALSGLYLTVKVGRWEAHRVLAGIDTDNDRQAVGQLDKQRVRRALFGTHILGFETAAPSVAVVLDDVFSAILALRPLVEATTQADRLAALAASPNIETPLLHAVSAPLPQDGDTLTYEAGLRTTLYRDLQVPLGNGRARRVRGVDILPVTGFMTTDPDPATAFMTTARRTARLALFEATAFAVSTASALAGTDLVPVEGSLGATLPGADPQALAEMATMISQWQFSRHYLVPSDAVPTAAWLFEPASGALYGLLGDGSAGGSDVQDIEDTFDDAEHLLSGAVLVGDVAKLLGLGEGFSFEGGFWIQLEKAKVKKLKAATIMIATLEPPAEDIADLSDLACDLAQDSAFEAAGAIAKRLSESLEKAIEIIGVADGTKSLKTGKGFFC